MKIFTKKSILQKIIISILTIILTVNFITPTYSNAANAADVGGVLLSPIIDLVCSLGDVVINILQRCMMGDWGTSSPNFSLNAFLMETSAYFGATDYEEPKGDIDETINPDEEFTKGWLWNSGEYYIPVATYSPEQIFTGNVAGLDINFLNPNKYQDSEGKKVESSAEKLQPTIASWYVALRNLAVVGLLSVLVYVGIRIIISSTASDKAKYKQMFMDWLIALCLLFFLHYIMSFVITLTESVCTAIGGDGQSTYIIKDETAGKSFSTNLLGAARFKTQYKDIGLKVTYLIFYIALVIYTVVFTYYYLKRLLMMAFLTLIAPLVALTYPIDKMSDGKAQAFDTWLKEYVYNALIQPFHLIMYTVFIGTAMDLASSNIIYTIAALGFILPAEKILRNFFGFNKAGAGTLGALSGFTAGSLASKFLSGGGKGSGKSQGGKDLPEGDKPPRFENKHDINDIEAPKGDNADNTRMSDDDSGDDTNLRLNADEEREKQELDDYFNNTSNEDAYLNQDEYQSKLDRYKELEDKEQGKEQGKEQNSQNEKSEDKAKIKGNRFTRGVSNLARHHKQGIKQGIKGVAKFGTRTAFKLAGGTIGAVGGLVSGNGPAAVIAGATAGASVGNKLGDSATRIPGAVVGAGRAATNAVRKEIDVFNGNTNMQDKAEHDRWKKDENRMQYVRDMMAKEEGGRIPSDKEVRSRMNSLDPYLAEGLTDIKDMLKAQKAEQYGITAKQSAIIAAVGKEKGINADILNDEKKLKPRMNNMKQEFINKGHSEKEAARLTDHTINVLKAQNGVAHNLSKPNNKSKK